jgi:hypothetical protein
MNAKSMPRAPLIIIGIIGGNLAVLDMHPDEHGALDRQNAGSDHVSAGCQRKIAGMTTLTVYINSTMPRVGQASRGNASREDVLRHPVEHEDLHDVRRRIHQRGRRIRTSGRTTGKPDTVGAMCNSAKRSRDLSASRRGFQQQLPLCRPFGHNCGVRSDNAQPELKSV